MLQTKKTIFFITRDQLKVAQVTLGRNPQVNVIGKSSWTKASLTAALKQVKPHLHTKKIRLLLSDDLSYLLLLNIPNSEKNQRQAISAKVSAEIPEVLADQDWDFAEVTVNNAPKDTTSILVFAPVQSVWGELITSLAQADIKFEAVESVSLAKKRHPDPIIGLAMKTDLKGQDARVLNLKPQRLASTSPTNESKTTKSKSKSATKKASVKQPNKPPLVRPALLIALAATFVIGAVIVGGVLVSKNALQKQTTDTEEPTENNNQVLVQTASNSANLESQPATASAQTEQINLTDYSLQVLNGSGVSGAASTVSEILETEGFTAIEIGNAATRNQESTSVQLKPALPDAVFATIDRVLNGDYLVSQSATALTEESDYDVVIIVGKRL